jgi:ribose/xylose/arabinose/galactoside ABC-type transport system permease subunit
MKMLGGLSAPGAAVWFGFLVGVLCCGLVGCASGLMVAHFEVAPFIVTLSVMMMGRGLAFLPAVLLDKARASRGVAPFLTGK